VLCRSLDEHQSVSKRNILLGVEYSLHGVLSLDQADHPDSVEAHCLGYDTHQTVALDIVRRPKTTPIHELERYMRCKYCSEVRGYPYKRSHLASCASAHEDFGRRSTVNVVAGGTIVCIVMDWQSLETFSFGDRPALADELVGLVPEGKKRATCWAVSEGLKGAAVGKPMVALGGKNRPRVVLKTIELTQRRFDQVDEAFAYDEGEGDRSLAYWRDAHKRYFSRAGLFEPQMMLWCERFQVEHVIERY